ncbi:pseudouridine synthase [Paraburkholderia madseniana]|uniref:Dual-specificity RNA pseudouridine synthase RluF n=2 Tax=Paraburkholderia TaxID=1822464 RepID=A0AAP5EMK8_9BURK|nr:MULTISPECIES: pseudouridine synthase [Paraburkholderia]MCX4145502.1 pseudouridine synthase [Paraburkholderia madseniana]MDN7148451.1 pseudouridine synthase [Paraburkholderia sp. WS6]MDQ6407331.1 pseudouridine synthase [Paraburkholderia madseniana]
MRVKLTAKHPRPASSERAPVRTGSNSARKPTRPTGPRPSTPTAGFNGARGEGAGAAGGGKRPAGAGKPAGAGARAPRAEGSFSRERDAGAARRAPSDRPPRREGAGGAPRRFEGSSDRAPRRDDGERAPRRFEGGGDRSERAPRRADGERSQGAPRRFEGGGDRAPRRDEGVRAPRKFEGGADRSERAPRRADGERPQGAPRRFEGGGDRAPRRDEGARAPRKFEGGADRSERAPRRADGERSQSAPRRFEGNDRPPRRDDSERAPRKFEGGGDRSERAPRRADGERSQGAPRRFEGTGDRGERAPRRFEGSTDRSERAPRSFEGNGAPRRDDGERRSFSGPRPGAGRPSEGGPRGERPGRDASDRPRFGSDRGAPQERRSDSAAPRRFEGERGASERGERTFAKPVKSGYGDRTDRPARAPRDDRGERAPAKREFGDRPPRAGERNERSDRGERPARSFDKALPAAGRRFGDDNRPARADKPRGPAPAARAERDNDADVAPRTPRRDYEDAPGTLRLSKLMSELGLCSRREADEWIEKGWVLVDGERIDTLGTKVRPDQRIEIDPAAEAAQASQVTVLIHKPVGLVSGQAEDGYQPAITLVTPENRWEGDSSDIRFSVSHLRQLAPAGRLDIDSTGLLVLTQDGRIAKQLIGGHSEIDKEYLVRVAFGEHTTDVENHFPPESLALLCHGLSLDDVPLKPAQVNWQNGEQLRFVLREGKKRQIRRMCELVGLEVIGLKRVRMGQVMLGALPPGQWRYLSADESF